MADWSTGSFSSTSFALNFNPPFLSVREEVKVNGRRKIAVATGTRGMPTKQSICGSPMIRLTSECGWSCHRPRAWSELRLDCQSLSGE